MSDNDWAYLYVRLELTKVIPIPRPHGRPNGCVYSECVGSGWHHQMETFFALLSLCEGNPSGFPSRRLETRSFDFSWMCAWTSGWANNRDAGDLRRHGAHCDVTVMKKKWTLIWMALRKTVLTPLLTYWSYQSWARPLTYTCLDMSIYNHICTYMLYSPYDFPPIYFPNDNRRMVAGVS